MNSTSLVGRLGGLLKGNGVDVERIAFVSTVIVGGATFWFAPRLPMVDLPQYGAQVGLWHDLLLGTSKWQALVYINYFTPYLVGPGLALLLSFILPVSAALKLVLALAYCGFVAACVALRGRLGGDRRLDWLFIPAFFGYAYAWGFYTFLVAAPLGVLFVLLAHRYADRPAPVPGIVLLLANLALFFSHGLVFLFANAIGAAFLLLKCRQLARLLPATLPYVAAGLWFIVYMLVRLGIETTSVGEPLHVNWGWDAARLNFLIFSMSWPLGAVEADWNFGPLLVFMLAAPMVLGARLNRRDATVFVPLGVTLLVWAFVPHAAMDTAFLYQRFAVFLLPFYAVMFCAPEPARRGVLQRLWLPVVCWAFLAVHAERLLAFARESAAFDDVLAATQPGHRGLALIFDPASAATRNRFAYLHFPLWYQAERGGFVDYNFAGVPQQVVRYRPDRAPAMFRRPIWLWQAPEEFDWTADQASVYRYFFVRHTAPLPQGYFPIGRCAPMLLKSAGAWSVFENVNCHTGM